jgi:hypothetical protein
MLTELNLSAARSTAGVCFAEAAGRRSYSFVAAWVIVLAHETRELAERELVIPTQARPQIIAWRNRGRSSLLHLTTSRSAAEEASSAADIDNRYRTA